MMKILSIIKPYDKPINTVGASWVGAYLSNALANDPRVDQVGLVTKLSDYSMISPKVKLYEVSVNHRSENKDLLTEAIRIYKEEDYDVIHIHIGSLAIIRWLDTLVPSDVNVVYTLHSSLMLGRSVIVYGPHGKNINNRSNIAIVAVSDFMQKVWREFTSTPVEDISNLSTIANACNEYPSQTVNPLSNRDKKVLLCGRITPAKNTYDILVALEEAKIPAIYVGDNYIINSNSQYEKDYYGWCKDLLEKSSTIEWYPLLTNNEVRNLMSQVYGVVHITAMESCALVVLESLSVGTPVIYADTEAVVEQMSKPYDCTIGKQVNFVSKSRWTTRRKLVASAVKELFDNPPDPEDVYNYYDKYFSLQRMVDKYISLYSSLINKQRRE